MIRKKLVSFICMLVLFSAFSLNVSSETSEGNTTDWYDETHVRTIQEGIDIAFDGDTIFVYNGTYYEIILIDKSITIMGEDRESTIIDGGNIGNIVILSSDFIKFSGFTIRNSDDDGIGIFVKGINGGLISSNIISDTFIGIRLFDKDKICYNNIITDNIILSSTAFGIELQNSKNNTLSYNTISGTKSGSCIYIEYYSYNNIISHNNLLYNNEGGIHVTSNNNVIVENNISSSGNKGIGVYYSSGHIIERNTISDCNRGIICYYVNNCYIKSNVLINNLFQLKGDYCSDITISGNTLIDSIRYGLYIESSKRIEIRENILENSQFSSISSRDNSIIKYIILLNYDICTYGIFIKNSTCVNISENEISNCINGIEIRSSSNNNIINNNIIRNDNGIFLIESDNNCIYFNNFRSNNKHASFLDCNNIWDANYWNRFRFFDYPIFGKMTLILPIIDSIQFLSINYDYNPAKEPYEFGEGDNEYSKADYHYDDPLSFRVEFEKLFDRVWKINGYATNTFDEEITVRWGCPPCVFAFFYPVPDEDLNLLIGQYRTPFYTLKFYNKWFEFEPGEEKLIDSKLFYGISNHFIYGLSNGYPQYFDSWPILPNGEYEVRASISPYQNKNYEMLGQGEHETIIFQYS
jgi:parallel beta-helix repeat protein